jgi:DNA (cytosine-5)-methyltransferase 1
MSLNQATELPLNDVFIPEYKFQKDETILIGLPASDDKGFAQERNSSRTDPFENWWMSFIANGFKKASSLENAKSVRYVDLFSSVGGLSLSFSIAARSQGLNPSPLMSVDVDSEALKVYKKNFSPMLTLNTSVSNLVDFQFSGRAQNASFNFVPEIIPDSVRDLKGIVDVVLAGPPCQGHSTLNNHTRGEDKRNFFYIVTAAVIAALQPKGFVIENVPNVVNDKTLVVESAKALLRNSGYVLSESTLAADSIGWAQTRKRHFLIGTLNRSIISLPLLYERSKRISMPVSTILERDSLLSSDPEVMNTDPQMSKENMDRIAWLFENDKFELPNSERPDCHKGGHTYPSVYGRMRPDEPAPTLTTGFMSPGRGRFIHPFERRTIRPREAARIQGFPDTFVFDSGGDSLTKSMLAKWIGDAVPSILGFLPASAVLNSI